MVGDHDAAVGLPHPFLGRGLAQAQDEGGLAARHFREEAALERERERERKKRDGGWDGVGERERARGKHTAPPPLLFTHLVVRPQAGGGLVLGERLDGQLGGVGGGADGQARDEGGGLGGGGG